MGEDGRDYYERWLDALEQVLLEQRIVSEAELGERVGGIAHEWDHDHDGHGHDHHDHHDHRDHEGKGP